jgi:hypothetical protein
VISEWTLIDPVHFSEKVALPTFQSDYLDLILQIVKDNVLTE